MQVVWMTLEDHLLRVAALIVVILAVKRLVKVSYKVKQEFQGLAALSVTTPRIGKHGQESLALDEDTLPLRTVAVQVDIGCAEGNVNVMPRCRLAPRRVRDVIGPQRCLLDGLRTQKVAHLRPSRR